MKSCGTSPRLPSFYSDETDCRHTESTGRYPRTIRPPHRSITSAKAVTRSIGGPSARRRWLFPCVASGTDRSKKSGPREPPDQRRCVGTANASIDSTIHERRVSLGSRSATPAHGDRWNACHRRVPRSTRRHCARTCRKAAPSIAPSPQLE